MLLKKTPYTCQIIIVLIFFMSTYWLFNALMNVWPFTIDDMYISLRYAKNWANGFGLVWNINQPPVEGYSNFSYVFLAFLMLKIGLNPVIILKAFGIVNLCFSSICTFFLSRFFVNSRFAVIPVFWLLYYQAEIVWAVSGLETIFFQSLLLLSLLFGLRANGYNFYPNERTNQKKNYFIITGLILALASLTRPEAPFIGLIFLLISLFDNLSVKEHKKYWQWGVISFLGVYLPYFCWRYWYFGFLFPNSIYCKAYNHHNFFILDSIYLAVIWPFIGLTLISLEKTKNKLLYYFFLPNILYVILLINADPTAAFLNRLFLPVFPMLLVLGISGINGMAEYLFSSRKTIAVLFLSLLILFLIPHYSLKELKQFTVNPVAGETLRFQVNDWLNSHLKNGSRVVLGDSGLIPYFSSLNFIDSACINNTDIPRLYTNNFQKFSKNIILEKPEAIIITSLKKESQIFYLAADEFLIKDVQKDGFYQLEANFCSINKDKYCYQIYKYK